MKTKILFFLLPIFLFAQKQKIQLLDNVTKKPLQFVQLLYNNESLFSDKNGNVFIDFNSDKIEVLDGNYKPNLIEISTNTESIELQNTVTELEEMVISKKPRTIINPQKKKLFDYFPVQSNGVMLNEIIFNKEYQNKYLRKIHFKSLPESYVSSIDGYSSEDFKKIKNATQILRINIYDSEKNLVFNSRTFEFISKNKFFFEIDIEDDILITDKPIFVEIQVIGAVDNTGYFIDNKIKMSIRPEQARNAPKEYDVKIWYKRRNSKFEYLDYNKNNKYKSYINFGFEFEDVD